LNAIASQSKLVGDVRGVGLMLGVEIVDPDLSWRDAAGAPAPELAAEIQRACLHHGLIVETGGQYGNVVRFLPPLTIEESDIAAALNAFESALAVVERTRATAEPALVESR
jgi:diaminobutyrate-2-oxoglutarate transaminase